MFVVRHILENGVETNVSFRFLYGLKLIGTSEVYKHLPEEELVDLLAMTVPESKAYPNKYLFIALYRTKTQEGYYLNEVYYLSYDKFLLKTIQGKIGNRAKWLEGHELANALIRLQTLYDDIQIRDKKPIRQVRYFSREDIFSPPVERSYREIIRQIERKKKEEGKEKRVLAGARLGEGENIRMEQLISLDWTGVVWIMLDMNDLSFILKRRKQTVYPERVEWRDIDEAYRNGKIHLVGNSVFFISEDENIDEYKLQLFSFLGYIPVEKVIDRSSIIRSTLLTRRDMDYIQLLTPDVGCKYLITQLERDRIPERPMIYGKSRLQNYVAFSYFDTDESENPHAIVLAPSGSGKSFESQGEISQILEVDLGKLVRGEPTENHDTPFRIRYFDKGYSAEIFFKLLKLRGYDVEIFSARPSELRFNPCEIFEEEDYEFSAHFVNAVLEVLNLEPMQGDEVLLYIKTLKKAKEDDRLKYYLSQKVSIIKGKSESLYRKIRESGFRDDDLIGDVAKKKGFENLAQPTLVDVHRLLTNTEGEVARSLLKKLSAVAEIPIFSFVSEIDIRSAKIFYLDLELLAESPYFVPLMLAILRRLFHQDKFYKPEGEYAIYFFDEVHNFFKVKAFEKALSIQVKEARRFRIQIRYATQNPTDIPAPIIMNMKTKILLAPQDQTEKEMFLSELLEHLGIENDKADPFYVFNKSPAYHATFWYSGGAFSLLLPVDEYKLKVFDSYRKVFETDDGWVIVKTTAPEERKRFEAEGRKVI